MTKEEFVKASKLQTSDAALFGSIAVLHRPPGRRPDKRDVALSEWYGDLNKQDQQFVAAAMKEAAELAIFSMFCILDGVSAVEDDSQKGSLRLTYEKGPEVVTLNSDEGEQLHDLYNELCKSSEPHPPEPEATREYTTGSAKLLRSLQTSRDGLDIQNVPRKEGGAPDDDSAPSIMLPKAEHRKL